MRYNVISSHLQGPLFERLGELYFITGNCLDLEGLYNRHVVSAEIFLSDEENQREELLKADVCKEFLSSAKTTFHSLAPANGSKICLLIKTEEAADSDNDKEIIVKGGEGDMPYKGDLIRQIGLCLEQIGRKLADKKLTMNDARCFIVTLKDFSDFAMTDNFLTKAFSNVPHAILFSNDVTDGWLVNIECRAE
jgi:hypothetical protein